MAGTEPTLSPGKHTITFDYSVPVRQAHDRPNVNVRTP